MPDGHDTPQVEQNRASVRAAFDRAMSRLGPFEPRPHLAVAVSGGADSMALALLAQAWVRRRHGRVTALTVDHGLRPEARAEARQAGRWLRDRGIEHRILAWAGGTTGSALQARARAARYALLEDWCARAGVVHLLTGHHLDDQAETFMMRLERGSGVSGLAAMAPVRERAGLRILRPLLETRRAELEHFLTATGQDWISDPSNLDPAFGRVRMRGRLPAFAARGLDASDLARLARGFGRVRRGLEQHIADLLARAAAPHAAGFILLDPVPVMAAPVELGLAAFARVLGAVGGGVYPPRSERLRRLFDALGRAGFGGATLAGCRVVPHGPRLLVCREAAACGRPVAVTGSALDWDGRFRLRLRAGKRRGTVPVTVGALGAGGWTQIRAEAPQALENRAARSLPVPVRGGLPALFDGAGPLEVPHIAYRRSRAGPDTVHIVDIRPFVPVFLAGPRVPADR